MIVLRTQAAEIIAEAIIAGLLEGELEALALAVFPPSRPWHPSGSGLHKFSRDLLEEVMMHLYYHQGACACAQLEGAAAPAEHQAPAGNASHLDTMRARLAGLDDIADRYTGSYAAVSCALSSELRDITSSCDDNLLLCCAAVRPSLALLLLAVCAGDTVCAAKQAATAVEYCPQANAHLPRDPLLAMREVSAAHTTFLGVLVCGAHTTNAQVRKKANMAAWGEPAQPVLSLYESLVKSQTPINNDERSLLGFSKMPTPRVRHVFAGAFQTHKAPCACPHGSLPLLITSSLAVGAGDGGASLGESARTPDSAQLGMEPATTRSVQGTQRSAAE